MKKSILPYWIIATLLALLAGCGPNNTPEIGVTLVVPTSIAGNVNTAVPEQPAATATPVNLAPTVTVPGDETNPDSGDNGNAESGEGTPGAPTPTLQPTATPGASPTLPPTDPAVTTVTNLPLPGLSRELLFIGDGALKRWQTNGQVSVLLPGGGAGPEPGRAYSTGDVSAFAVAENGRFLVAARVTFTDPVSRTVSQTFEIVSLNLDSREARVLVPAAQGVISLALAGNGEHMAYITQAASDPAAESVSEVRVVQTGSGTVKMSKACSIPCHMLAWHPDHKNIAWGDGETGVWLYNVDGTEPQLLLPHQATGANSFAPIAWARNGRYLLLVNGQNLQSGQAVFDVPTGQVMPVPGSLTHGGLHLPAAVWMQDNRLLVSKPADPDRLREAPLLEIWRANPDAGQLVREETDAMPVAPSGIAAPVHLLNGRFGFALYHPTDGSVTGLYILKGFGDTLERVNGALPALNSSELAVFWNPDGSGAVISYKNGITLYAPAGSSTLYRVEPLLGSRADGFHWLPPRLP